ncbi:hypothetical protein FACS1894147_10900 [Spirochaetia bacterium]|nr:hypothetical protein FACS1894147_10900 [Spirochaetia bacterium]
MRYISWRNVFRIGAVLFTLAALLPAMDWPLDTQSAEGVVLERNFGFNDGGRPLLGTVFRGQGTVEIAEDGELLFVHRDDDTAGALPSPLGSWAAIDHGDEIISIYSRLEDMGDTVINTRPWKKYPLASMGRSGWSDKSGVYFSLFDRKQRRWVNPSMIISPFQDTLAPVIQSVRLKNADGVLVDPAVTRIISQGRYTVIVRAYDTLKAANESPLAPHRLICTVNGSEIGQLRFETFSARDGALMVNRNGLVPAREAYATAGSYEIGELWFTRGQASLEIIAQDVVGNTRNLLFRLAVD